MVQVELLTEELADLRSDMAEKDREMRSLKLENMNLESEKASLLDAKVQDDMTRSTDLFTRLYSRNGFKKCCWSRSNAFVRN